MTTPRRKSEHDQPEQIVAPVATAALARIREARALAELIYDMYKHDQANGKVVDGQNNAQNRSS